MILKAQRLCQWGRRRAAATLRRALSPLPSGHWSSGRPAVAGFTRSPSGIGESARLCFAALRALGHDPDHHDLTTRFQPEGMLAELPGARDDAPATGPIIIHANPPEVFAALSLLRGKVRGRRLVGYWAWELERAPRAWADAGRHLHEIWVPSHYCAEAIAPLVSCPVRVVPHPVAVTRPAAPDRSLLGAEAENTVVFLAVCDLRSSLARKNPEGAVAAFRRAFGDAADRLLVIKVGGRQGNDEAWRRLRAAAEAPNIRLLDHSLPGDAMAAMVAGCDVLVSLHRSEGFGLLPAQAMLAGRPVIATDWSGTRDFLRPDWAELVPARLVPVADPQGIYPSNLGQWAEPDIAAAAAAMARLAQSSDLRRALGEAGEAEARRLFSAAAWWEHTGDTFRQACATAPRA